MNTFHTTADDKKRRGWRRRLRTAVPSMFHRRLLLLIAAALVIALGLGAQTLRLTSGQTHRESLQAAESVLLEPELVPTVRGRVLDRHGRVLALDEPAWDVAVSFGAISGTWSRRMAIAEARDRFADRWDQMNPEERDALAAQLQPPYDQQLASMWRTLADVTGQPADVLQQRRQAVVGRVQRTESHLWELWRRQRARELGEPVRLADVAEPIAERGQRHVVVVDLPEAARTRVQGFIAAAGRGGEEGRASAVWSQVRVLPAKRRRYPFAMQTVVVDRASLPTPLRGEPIEMPLDGVGQHVVGLLRPMWSEDQTDRPWRTTNDRGEPIIDLGGYLVGDRVGQFGVEAMMEQRLRGTRGREVTHLDSGLVELLEARPGLDVQLTLDIALQARVQAIMDPRLGLLQTQPWHDPDAQEQGRVGTRLNGAAVVLEIDSGDVLAAVSVPAIPMQRLIDDPASVHGDELDLPMLNRPFTRALQPGSTVKPLVLAAAVTQGVLGPNEMVPTPGYLYPNSPNFFRDWLYQINGQAFGDIDGVFAIARSSNVFFGILAQRLGSAELMDWYRRFGLGEQPGTGLPGEADGDLPDGREVGQTDAALTAIGQGPITWTPLQAAAAYATLARGGHVLPARLVRTVGAMVSEPRGVDHIELSPTGVRMALEGMRQSANESIGTTHHLSLLSREPIFNVDGMRVWAKSGTAQASPQVLDGRVVRDGNHSWVVAYAAAAGQSQPQYVIVVVLEHAGSGGQVSGPVANQIIHALRREGYLGAA